MAENRTYNDSPTFIPARLESAVHGLNPVADAKDIYDIEHQKWQKEVNQEVEEQGDHLNQVDESLNSKYDKDETYSKTEVDTKESGLQGQINTIKGGSTKSIAILDNEINGTGGINQRLEVVEELGTISVGSGDIGIATEDDFGSDTPTDLAKVPTVGAIQGGLGDGVYDISARNEGAAFDSLEALLNDDDLATLIPTHIRKGGMSIKFIQSSDNKYIKYFLTKNEWSANVGDWEKMNLEDEVSLLGQVVERDKNNAWEILNNANSSKYNESSFQSGYISPTTGKNVYDNTYIRTEALMKTNDSFYLLTSENIKGFIYFYSEYNLDSFTKCIELISGNAYYIPDNAYYRLAFCYSDYSTPIISDIVDNVQRLRLNTTDIDINHSKNIVQHSKLSQYDTSVFQSGNISKTDGQNIFGNSYIRTIPLLIAKKDFYLIISNDNIGGIIYYYSDFALNSYTEAVELKSNVAYYIPVDTYYRLVFFYKDSNTPVISSIIDDVKQLQYDEPNIDKLQAVTIKMLDASLFQSGSISTETGTNVANNYYVRTTALLKANETYLISLPEYIKGRIYYYSEHLLTSYTGYVDLLPNSLNYIGKGTEYRLVFYYTDYQYKPQPVVADIIGKISKTYNIIDRIESIDLNADKSSWTGGGIAVDTGELVTEQYNKRIRAKNIKSTEYSIWATGCYKVSVYVYNGDSYLGCLNDNNTLSKETIKWWSKIDLNEFASKNPEYKFSIVACRSLNGNPIEDVMTAAEGENIKMLSPFEMKLFVKDTVCPIVSFIDDDLPDEAIENWYSIGNDTGIRCGFAVPTASISEDRWNQIKRLQSDGFDFLSHTHNHINLMNTDPEVIATDLQLSVEAFANHGIKVNALVYPQSSINDAALTVLKKYFEYSFNGGRGLSSIQGNPLRQHNITRSDTLESGLSEYTDPDTGITYQVHAMLPLSDLKACVDKAVEENCWVIFESHFRNSRTTDPSTNDGFIFTPEMRQNVIELIRYAVSRGCKVLTPSEGYNVLKNRLKRGTYGGGSYYIVDHNGFVYRKNM